MVIPWTGLSLLCEPLTPRLSRTPGPRTQSVAGNPLGMEASLCIFSKTCGSALAV